jgi:xanthine phosphoribosyltransferase
MELLKQRILADGVVSPGNVLKVDSFLNHQIDVKLLDAIADEFQRLYADKPINKVLTLEASGIAGACCVAQRFGVPLVFAKKSQSINREGDVYCTRIESFTHGRVFDVIVSKKYLSADDRVFIVDDFLANACALNGLIALAEEAGAVVEGIGIVIEKGFQRGGADLRDRGYPLTSLAIIESMDSDTGEVIFR